MSEDKKIPPAPPPDDFSATTPNIKLPQTDEPDSADWAKTNYNFPKQPAADDWGKTVTNIRPIDTEQQDFGKTFYPGSSPKTPQTPDWGVTHANAKVSEADFGSAAEDYGVVNDKTTPYFRLPEAERAKYQNLPPTPTEKAAQEKLEKEKQGGIPMWAWVSAGLLCMFFFAIVVLGVVWYIFLPSDPLVLTVQKAPIGSRIIVDDTTEWGVSSEDGDRKLQNLAPGRRKISIVSPTFNCTDQWAVLETGKVPEPIIAQCSPKEVADDECQNIRLGDFDKAELCYYKALKALPDPYTGDELTKALNILIINFDIGKSTIPPERLQAIKDAAGYINKLPTTTILEIGGHTDNSGDPAKNQVLSEQRANAVKDKLVNSFGVKPDVLQTKGYGATKPKTDNSTDFGKFINRRIEYTVIKQ